ncbi:hypothetical protein [Ferrimonas marina]|uniref:Uncharacterized protein n=1 Tax=Ferrimonas marina TaxID=299255 RepID=A0A1M5TBY9_9GAMM|nr:hypothetical protein [Ferrimonas marina]SHH48325.1 hypothetical protein SAMN02745129_2080 [Ferrimonas marina]
MTNNFKALLIALTIAAPAVNASAYSCATDDVEAMQSMAEQLEATDENGELMAYDAAGNPVVADSTEDLAEEGYESSSNALGPLQPLMNCATLGISVISSPSAIKGAMCDGGCAKEIAEQCKFSVGITGIKFENPTAAPICLPMMWLVLAFK